MLSGHFALAPTLPFNAFVQAEARLAHLFDKY